MDESEMCKLTAAQLRVREAEYFLMQFLKHCGPPRDSYFLMVCYLDAFLTTVVSVGEMMPAGRRKTLADSPLYRFAKALRNINTHHSVLAALPVDGKFVRPFRRHASNSVGGQASATSNLEIRLDVLKEIFEAVEIQFPSEKKTIDVARRYLAEMEDTGQEVFIESVMKGVLSLVSMAANESLCGESGRDSVAALPRHHQP